MRSSPAYLDVSLFYKDKFAARSGIHYMNHINEGLYILDVLHVDNYTKDAFCLHPLFDTDENLVVNRSLIRSYTGIVAMYVMEFRHIRNQSLNQMVTLDHYHNKDAEAVLMRPFRISPLPEVNNMLIADKVQNKKDFLKYHKGTHAESIRLELYFNEWLYALGVDESKYNRLVGVL